MKISWAIGFTEYLTSFMIMLKVITFKFNFTVSENILRSQLCYFAKNFASDCFYFSDVNLLATVKQVL